MSLVYRHKHSQSLVCEVVDIYENENNVTMCVLKVIEFSAVEEVGSTYEVSKEHFESYFTLVSQYEQMKQQLRI